MFGFPARITSCVLCLLALVLAQVWVGSAHAQVVAESAISEPQSLVDKGLALRDAGKDEEALAQFQQAYALERDARTLTQIALAEQALGKWLDAFNHLRDALSSTDHPWVARNLDLLRGELKSISQHIGALEIRCAVEGAEVFVNNVAVGLTPLPQALSVQEGTALVEVRAQGYVLARHPTVITGSNLTRLEVPLYREPTPAPVEPVTPGPQPDPPKVVGSDHNELWIIGIVGGGLIAVTGMAVWTVADSKTGQLESDCEQACTNARIAEVRSNVKSLDTIGNVLVPVGAVIAVSSAALYLLWTEPEESTGASAWIAPNSAGVMVHGSL